MLNQLPHDPTSGAARHMREMAEVLASAGFVVRTVATTATESVAGLDARAILRESGVEPVESRDAESGAPVLRFTHRGVPHTILDVGIATPQSWEAAHGRAFDILVRDELESLAPEIVLTFGAHEGEMRRRIAARRRGATIVFVVQNLAYMDRRAFLGVDAVATVSRFVTGAYRHHIGLESTVLPPVLTPEDVIAEGGSHRCVTFVNPTKPKGVMFFATLAAELSRARPEMPILVVEARSGSAELLGAARAGGLDLASLRNIVVSKPVARPRMFLGASRVVVVPSVWPEAFGRIAAEALVNGVPPIVSDRGGLPEAAAGGGFVLPLPDDYTAEADRPVSPDAVRRWRDTVMMLMDDDGAYAAASARARAAGARYHADVVRPQILTFFARVCRLPGDTVGPFVQS
jgi:glycosyltransferase involved in cell wall biosynthesis